MQTGFKRSCSVTGTLSETLGVTEWLVTIAERRPTIKGSRQYWGRCPRTMKNLRMHSSCEKTVGLTNVLLDGTATKARVGEQC